MADEIERLDLVIGSSTSKASKAVEDLITSLSKLETGLASFSGDKLDDSIKNLSTTFRNLSEAINIVNVESSTYDPNKDNNNATAVVNIISNETESNDTVIKESVSSSSPLALYPTANPFAIVILALLSIVFVRLRRIKL